MIIFEEYLNDEYRKKSARSLKLYIKRKVKSSKSRSKSKQGEKGIAMNTVQNRLIPTLQNFAHLQFNLKKMPTTTGIIRPSRTPALSRGQEDLSSGNQSNKPSFVRENSVMSKSTVSAFGIRRHDMDKPYH
eukprot:TRINITY_DN12105_c0_g5_i2.p1 TRINITY_DN12105_c0_g5~~TRINITY_DN12105_c0_g5_i2.p1  ORF type:complete len:131 (+),score=15.41 TRINITY_DN12105_c0_g5_i2:243-635(+)